MIKFYPVFFTPWLLLLVVAGKAQDLEPRAYVWVPVQATFLVAGYGYSHGGVLTDPTAPVQDLQATLNAPSVGAGHVFSLMGNTTQVSAAVPFAWAGASGSVLGSAESISRTGFGDVRLRISTLLIGAPSMSAPDIAKAPHKTIFGTSLSIIAPTGQYFPEKLINLGVHRWSFKPELALSQPVGKRWLVDVYAGVWFFTKNKSYYPGNSVREQDPMGAFQTHVSYNITRRMWAALNLTYYTGGVTTVNGVQSDDRQDNSRIGGTLVVPVKKRHSVKFAYSTGAVIRSGADFTTISVGWQTFFLGKPKSK